MGFKKDKSKDTIKNSNELSLENNSENKVEENIDDKNKENTSNKENEEVVYLSEEDKAKIKKLREEDKTQDILKRIEKKREEFNKVSKKIKIANYVVVGVLLVILVAAFILALTIGQNEEYTWVTILALVLAIVLLIASYIFQRFQRKKMEKEANKYLAFVYESLDELIYNDENLANVKFDLFKSEKELFLKARYFTDLKKFMFLNTHSATYKGIAFESFDASGCKIVKNKNKPYFVGRCFVFALDNVEEDTRILLQLKGKEYSYPVDDIDGLKVIEDTPKHILYANDEKSVKYISNKVMGLIKRYHIAKPIYDVIISINENMLFIGIDYEDNFLTVPNKETIDLSKVIRSKEDLDKAFDIFNEISSIK